MVSTPPPKRGVDWAPQLAIKSDARGVIPTLFPTRRGMVPAVRGLLDALVSGYEAVGQNEAWR